jgi:pimeloyl-ACP methyl ester carboxylesterase
MLQGDAMVHMPARGITILLLGTLLMTAGDDSRAGDGRETSVCGAIREPFAFWMFRRAAGAADDRRVAGIRDLDSLTFTAGDGRRLAGYRLRAARPQGYVLVAQGNAMLADQIIGEFRLLRERGYDVYVYDYRGYGRSEGRSRLRAIVADYRELVADLNAREYPRRLLYGMSMGGVILLNAVGANNAYDALVVDSSPARISNLGCPREYDPPNHLPADGARLRLIVGARDRVVYPVEMEALVRAARARGARVIEDPEFAHPFQDVSPAVHRRRLQTVADLLR